MKKNKIIIFFILVILLFIFFTLCDYFLGYGFGVAFTWREFVNKLPWTISGSVISSLYGIIGLDIDDYLIKLIKRLKK